MHLCLERCELQQDESPLPSFLTSRRRRSYGQKAHAVARRTAVGTIQRLLGQIRWLQLGKHLSPPFSPPPFPPCARPHHRCGASVVILTVKSAHLGAGSGPPGVDTPSWSSTMWWHSWRGGDGSHFDAHGGGWNKLGWSNFIKSINK